MTPAYHVSSVAYLGGYGLRLTFADARVADIDPTAKLQGDVGPVFEPLRDERYFAQMVVDKELGTVVWPNGADLAPDVLHKQAATLI
ncbi:MAG TPA: DUF2442 domain-containing protein [Acidimicrobiales bacterium]|jgi:hypothetical protein